MATAKNKRTPNAKTPAKRAPAKKTPASKRKPSRRRQVAARPMLGLGLLAICVLLLFCLLSASNAMVVVSVRGAINGTFGVLGWLALILLGVLGAQIALGDRWPLRRIAWLQAALIVLCLATLLEVFRMDDILRALRAESYIENYNGFMWKAYDVSRNVPVGGGSLGAVLAYPLGTYLDVLGSALLLFFVMFGLLFWLIRTVAPSSGERVGEWFAQIQEDWAERRAERNETRAKTREERAGAAMERKANAALLTKLPEELLEEDEAPPQRVAKGRRQASAKVVPMPEKEKAVQQTMWQRPPEGKAPPVRQEPVHSAPPPSTPRAETPAPKRPAAAVSAEPQASRRRTPVRGSQRTTRLYIENNVPIRRDIPIDAYTEYDAERYKHIQRQARRDPNAVPEFVVKEREVEQTVPDDAWTAAVTHEPPPQEQAGIAFESWVEEDAREPEGEPAEAWIAPEPEPAPQPARARPAGKTAPYAIENHLDRQPELDAETRLDRPDWKPPEPEPAPQAVPEPAEYRQPPFSLLLRDERRGMLDTRDADAQGAQKLEETLASFGVSAKVIKVVHGPAITRYELQPAPGVKVSKIVGLTDDIALNMAAVGVRIEAPIPGKAAIGIEIANEEIHTVHLRDVLESDESLRNPSKLAVALGKDIAGKRIIADLARMPHLLIAGATGSGKSVCINTLIASIIYRARPEEVRMILIDPKKVELAVYNGIPHLLVPVVTDPKKASGALAWAVMEMDERYKLFAEIGVRDIKGYNAHRADGAPLMPQIVVIIDELSDLMLVAPGEVEESICRLAQLARACGIHLVIATQRPSVNVITGIIKANIPSRIAFAVSSQVDSRTILDTAGADKLLGKGDMLYAPSGGGKPLRVQGCFVSDEEVARVVDFVKDCHTTDYSQAVIDALDTVEEPQGGMDDEGMDESGDALFVQAVEMAIESGQTSISMLQRRLRIGYARAGRLVDEMAKRGIVGPADGAKPREVLMTREEFNLVFRQE